MVNNTEIVKKLVTTPVEQAMLANTEPRPYKMDGSISLIVPFDHFVQCCYGLLLSSNKLNMMFFIQIFTLGCLSALSLALPASYNLGTLALRTQKTSSRLTAPSLGHILLRANAAAAKYGGTAAAIAAGKVSPIIPIARQIRHNVDYKEVPVSGSIHTPNVEVGASAIPINIIFRSASSALNVLQQHQPAQGDTQESSSEDEPHRLLHTVTKPIIQEIHEVISPYRKITQEVQPVQEEIQTIVARGTPVAPSAQQQQAAKPPTLVQPAPPPPSAPYETININDGGASLAKVLGGPTNNLLTDDHSKSIAQGLDKSLSKSVALILSNKSQNTAVKSYSRA